MPSGIGLIDQWIGCQQGAVARPGCKIYRRRSVSKCVIRSAAAAERALFTKRRKEAYEALHPETRKGSSQAIGMNASLGHDVSDKLSPTFAVDTAIKTGVNKRTVERDASRGEKVSPDLLNQIAGTALDTGQSERAAGCADSCTFHMISHSRN